MIFQLYVDVEEEKAILMTAHLFLNLYTKNTKLKDFKVVAKVESSEYKISEIKPKLYQSAPHLKGVYDCTCYPLKVMKMHQLINLLTDAKIIESEQDVRQVELLFIKYKPNHFSVSYDDFLSILKCLSIYKYPALKPNEGFICLEKVLLNTPLRSPYKSVFDKIQNKK